MAGQDTDQRSIGDRPDQMSETENEIDSAF